jgi:site-specific DNA-cytosine methylase
MLNVVSLFDGIGGARVALDRLNIPCNYFASEIDQHAIKVHLKNYPKTLSIGSVKDIKGSFFKQPIDLLIGGSPCQDLSRGGNKTGLSGQRSGLFFEYLRLLKEIKPKYFLLENVKSMKKSHQDEISQYMGCDPYIINASNFTAQNRTRCYWTNIIPDSLLPYNDLRVKDIWDYNQPIQTNQWLPISAKRKNNQHGMMLLGYLPCSNHAGPPLPRELVFSIEGKARAVSTAPSQFPLYAEKVNGVGFSTRILTPDECERLQGLPGGYTYGASDLQRYKMIGNGFCVPVIEYILKGMK